MMLGLREDPGHKAYAAQQDLAADTSQLAAPGFGSLLAFN